MTPGCRFDPVARTLWLQLHIQPGARNTAWVGRHGDAYKIRLAALPIEGKANHALCQFLAEQLGLPRESVELLRGATGRRKQVLIRGVTEVPAFLREDGESG